MSALAPPSRKLLKAESPIFILAGYDAQDHIGNIKATPILLMHSKQDPVVAYHHSQQLFERGQGRAQWIETEGGHIGGFNEALIREKFLDFLEANGV